MMSGSSSSGSSSYEVFLSFRGTDTRKNFVDHLYAASAQAGIHTFRDAEVPRGEEISPQLRKAIQQSRISLVVLSRGYASSRWCLDELVEILECKHRNTGQIVIPIFYDIDPSDVRKQRGSFKEAFDRHEERFKEEMETVSRWRGALHEVASLPGFGLKDGHEAVFVREIVNVVMAELGNKWTNDVFLSFRGTDTRKNFVDHLYAALSQARIHTFRDDDEFPRGEEISPQLRKAIQQSRISLVVLSRGYASSRWCLDELVEILECKHRNTGQIVLPIFYDIDRSDVWKQRGSFKEAFDRHEERFKEEMETVSRWRGALHEVASLPGFVLGDGHEAVFVREIVDAEMAELGNKWTNDVFLSFMGEDTHKNFTDHLYAALARAGVRIFRDDDEVPRGEEISQRLRKAIQQTRISLVVLSRGYASSRWCLDELIEILECKNRNTGQIVIPIFYDIDPSDVRKQRGSFKEAFDRHEERFKEEMETVSRWRGALHEVASLPGFVLGDGHEAVFVREIVNEVMVELGNKWTSDVFLNFRGTDTRKNFVDHLYAALSQAGIHTFRDYDVPRGEEISSRLRKAIQQSRISLVVLSRGYASSRWCLDELVEILECKHRNTGQIVIPIFYDIDPSDVQRQRGSFEEAFDRHEERFKEEMETVSRWRGALHEVASLPGFVLGDGHEAVFVHEIVNVVMAELGNKWTNEEQFEEEKVNQWREALTKIGNLPGLSLHGMSDPYESKFIGYVVNCVKQKLDRKLLGVAACLVGIDCRVTHVLGLLAIGINDVRVVGIHGMAGIGKTTIAKGIFNKLHLGLDRSCFLFNIKEKSERPNGLVQLQGQFLSDIMGWNYTGEIDYLDRGMSLIKQEVGRMRVLLVLDDVVQKEQVHALIGEQRWFGPGSRIIITTRDEGLLDQLQVDEKYLVEALDQDESLQLFSWHAFRQFSPAQNFFELSKRAVACTGGLPLALEFLGSYLFGQSIHEWVSAIEELKTNPIQKELENPEIFYIIGDGKERKKSSKKHRKCSKKSSEEPVILYVQTRVHLYEINPQVQSSLEPALEPKVNFVEEGLPLHMGFFKLKLKDDTCTKVFAMGGELVKRCASYIDIFRDNPDVVDTSFGKEPFQGMVTNVYEFDPSNSTFKPTNSIPNMMAPKGNPVVVQPIMEDSKVFVHQALSVFRSWHINASPIFECYDPIANKWQKIDDLPYPLRDDGKVTHLVRGNGIGYGVFVVGHKLFIPCLMDFDWVFSCFNSKMMSWEPKIANNLINSFSLASLKLPSFGRSVSGLDDVMTGCSVLFAMPCIPVINAYLIHESGCLLRYQSFPWLLECLDKMVFDYFEYLFLDLGQGRMCTILTCAKRGSRFEYLLHVCIFHVTLLMPDVSVTPLSSSYSSSPSPSPSCYPQEEEQFVQLNILHQHSYTIPEPCSGGCPGLSNAFCL